MLAVHPDYILRNDILQELRQRWFALSNDGWHDVIVGLLKEKQLEMALNKLEEMEHDGQQVYTWLYDMFVYTLCEVEEFDNATNLLKHRVDRGETMISANMWFYVLDSASRALHVSPVLADTSFFADMQKYEATLYTWKKRVETAYLNPPSGVCLNVLTTAARHGDADLATDVFRILGDRKTRFDLNQYETLLDAYVADGNIKTALTILCIMKASGGSPDEGSTRSIFHHLRQDPGLPKKAFDSLLELREARRAVPTCAVNCIIEASVHLGDLPQAIEHYKGLRTVCPDGPDTVTFNTLFRGCNNAHRKDLAMFLASEMRSLKVKPNALTYDRLLLVCLGQDDYEDAFRYLDEMKSRGWTPRQGTLVAMAKKCAENGDDRAFDVYREIEAEGFETGNIRKWLRDNWAGLGDVTARLEDVQLQP